MDKIAVLIPCYNESATIAKVVKDYRAALPEAAIYVYDNNSTDGTDEIARAARAQAQSQKSELERINEAVERHSAQQTKAVQGVLVEGMDNCLIKFSRCCTPVPGDDIVGFITQGRGISVHRADCDQLAELQSHAPERIVDAVWGESYSAGYSLVVRVEANDRSGLLRDITTILANEKVNVLGVASRSDTRQQLATIDMTIEIYNLQVLGRVLGKLNQVPDVIDARRLHGN